MRRIERAIVSAFAAASMICATAVSLPAQEPAPPPSQPSRSEVQSVQGELMQVDTEKQMIVLRTSAQTPMAFQYNDRTEVSGAQESIAGLATTRGARVTVHYTESAGVRTATKIDVQAEEP